METEDSRPRGAMAQPPAREAAGVVRRQRAVEASRSALNSRDARIGRRPAPTGGRGVSTFSSRRWRPAARRCRTPRGGRARRGDAATCRAIVRPAPRSSVGDIGEMRGQRQLAAEQVQLLEIEAQRPLGLHCSVPRMTSAVTKGLPSRSPPIQLPMRRNDANLACLPADRSSAGPPAAMQPRHLAQEGIVVVRQAVGDLVEHP